MCGKEQLDEIMNKILTFSEETLGASFRAVILYGSYARGEQEADSDIDIMIVADMDDALLQSKMREYSRFGTALAMEYGVLLSVVLQDEASLNRWKKIVPFYRNVLSEGVRLSA